MYVEKQGTDAARYTMPQYRSACYAFALCQQDTAPGCAVHSEINSEHCIHSLLVVYRSAQLPNIRCTINRTFHSCGTDHSFPLNWLACRKRKGPGRIVFRGRERTTTRAQPHGKSIFREGGWGGGNQAVIQPFLPRLTVVQRLYHTLCQIIAPGVASFKAPKRGPITTPGVFLLSSGWHEKKPFLTS